MPRKIAVQRQLGVPYPQWTDAEITASIETQEKAIARDLRDAGAYVAPDREIIALIAYLQQMGHYEKVTPTGTAPTLAD